MACPPPHSSLQKIEALVACHRDSPYAKFWGACNEQKWALDRCFREEKAINRHASLCPLSSPRPDRPTCGRRPASVATD